MPFDGIPTYEEAGLVYDQPEITFGAQGDLWLFRTPGRITHDLEGRFAWSIWTRVKVTDPVAVVQHADASWTEEFPLPWTLIPSNKYLYGKHGFSNGDNIAFDVPKRLYMGGHTYIIDDTLRGELESAVTTQEPAGYGAYITAAPQGSVFTGDEIIASAYQTEAGRPNEAGVDAWSA